MGKIPTVCLVYVVTLIVPVKFKKIGYVSTTDFALKADIF